MSRTLGYLTGGKSKKGRSWALTALLKAWPRLNRPPSWVYLENRRAKKVAVEEDSFKVQQGDMRKIKEDRTIKPEMQVAVFLRPVITIRRRGVMTFNRKPLMGWGL